MTKTKEENNKKTCFIITPIGNDTDPIRRHIDGIIDAAIRPALGDEYDIKVAHQMFSTGSINKQVIQEIYSCDLAIANLTNKNPNVMYELAFRHCLGKPIIQIMEDGTNLPFDVINERTISYINDSKGVLELKDALINFVKEINFNEKNQGPIYDIIKNINKEIQLFEYFEKDSKVEVDKDILKYLLNRIDNIDSKLESNSKSVDKSKITKVDSKQ